MYIFYPMTLRIHYILSVPVITTLLFSLALISLSRYKIGIVAIVLYVLLQSFFVVKGVGNPLSKAKELYANATGSYKNQLQAADWVYQSAKGGNFGYFVYDPPIVTYGMDYLMLWRGKTTYDYIPKNEKLPISYLIMYPPPAMDPGSHDFWIKNVVRTNGKDIEKKVFSTGMIVRKVAIAENEEPADPNYFQNLIFR